MSVASSKARARLAICLAGVLSLGSAVIAQLDSDPSRPRVRSSHAYIRAMIDEAARRSVTFRRLVEAIEASDGIVYVEQGECSNNVRACLTLSITPTADYRFLRVLVDARKPDWDVMASIGHELRHAIEVLSEASVRSSEAIFLLYMRAGMLMGDSFETSAAMRTGDAVRNEVASFSRRH